MPLALVDDAFQGDTVSSSAPGEEEDVGVGGGNGFGCGVGAGYAEETASGGFNEFGDPMLGVNEGLAPLFAVDEGAGRGGGGAGADFGDRAVHGSDEGFSGVGGLND